MDIKTLINELKKANEHQKIISKHTLLVNDKSQTLGALFFICSLKKEYKLMIPAPFHSELLKDTTVPTALEVLQHKEVLLLQ